MKNEKICICGPSGSGKDFLLRGLIKKGEKYSPKITTRPKRQNEVDGVDYIFTTNEDFDYLMGENQHLIKCFQKFEIKGENWYYYITQENFDNNSVFIVTPHELSFLTIEERKGCFVVYLDIDEDTRRKRISRRNDNKDSVERRILSDKEDFYYFKNYDMKITDPEFEIDMIYGFAY